MSPARDSRKADLAKIHLAKKQLRLDDDTYRDMLWTIARVRSSADLNDEGRRRVLQHLVSRGFSIRRKKSFPGRPHNVDSNAQLKKIEALLADAKRPWSYVDSMAQRMFNVDRIAFCDAQQLHKLIAALVADQSRRANKERSNGQ